MADPCLTMIRPLRRRQEANLPPGLIHINAARGIIDQPATPE